MHAIVAEQIAAAHRQDLMHRAELHRATQGARRARTGLRGVGARVLVAAARRLDPVVAGAGDLRLQG